MEVPEIVRKYVRAWEDHDLDGWLSTFGSGGTYCSAGTPPVAGADLREQFTDFFNGFPAWNCETVGTYALTDKLAVWRWVITATHSGEWRGMPPTGRTFTVHGVEFIETEGGKVARAEGYFDRLSLLAQLGLLPAPAQSS